MPGEVYECDVEISADVDRPPDGLAPGPHRARQDYEYTGELSSSRKSFHYATRGTGGMTHADPDDRPPAIFDNQVRCTPAASTRRG